MIFEVAVKRGSRMSATSGMLVVVSRVPREINLFSYEQDIGVKYFGRTEELFRYWNVIVLRRRCYKIRVTRP